MYIFYVHKLAAAAFSLSFRSLSLSLVLWIATVEPLPGGLQVGYRQNPKVHGEQCN